MINLEALSHREDRKTDHSNYDYLVSELSIKSCYYEPNTKFRELYLLFLSRKNLRWR